MDKKKAGELVMTLLHARTATHVLHLSTQSYAEHKALNKFYDALPDLVDSWAEAYQGRYGLIEDYPSTYKHPARESARPFLIQLRSWLEERRAECKDSELANILDEIIALFDSTIYKLRYLK